MALDEGRFKSVNVDVGKFDSQSAEILGGLEEGDRVVTSAQFLLDSESSKTSDFVRMNHQVMKQQSMGNMDNMNDADRQD
jgi:Cu(I)/Ag(I) efflux system membrane fusion protein